MPVEFNGRCRFHRYAADMVMQVFPYFCFSTHVTADVLFLASNGNPRLPDSLHYIDPSGRPNVYQKVRPICSCVRMTLQCSEHMLIFSSSITFLRQYWKLVMFYSIMIQLSVSLLGVSVQDLLMALFPIVST